MSKTVYKIDTGYEKKAKFSLNDPIFRLERATEDLFGEELACYVCEKKLKKGHKNIW